MALVALVIAAVTLIVAVLIHSETRDALSQMKAIVYTLPGAHDVSRLMVDIEKTRELRGKVILHESKSTHIAYKPSGPKVPLVRWIPHKIWRFGLTIANCFSGNIEIPLEKASGAKWETKSGLIKSPEVTKLLEEGWEPFSVTSDNNLWLRRRIWISGQKVKS